MTTVRLHVNVDHVATLRQARGTDYPDPARAAALAEGAGAAGITVHLREDRRHVQDGDVTVLRASVTTLLNLEMAVTDEMIGIATQVLPDLVTLVPEKREERTTEGGLDVVGAKPAVADAVRRLEEAGIPVSLFIDPEEAQIRASIDVGAASIELHTGDYANARGETAVERELARLADASATARRLSATLRVAAGHGLTLDNTAALVARMPEVEELNIGHALVSDAIFLGMEGAVEAYLRVVEEGRRERA